jgi:hypothetical protein
VTSRRKAKKKRKMQAKLKKGQTLKSLAGSLTDVYTGFDLIKERDSW